MTPNVATIRRVARWDRDSARGRVAEFEPDRAPVPCAIQPASAEDVPEAMRDAGVGYYVMKVYDDPEVRVRDQVVDELGRVFSVAGVRSTSGGAGRTHLVDLELREVARARPA